MEHYKECEASICVGDPNTNYKKEVLWYPGEPVCQKKPYQLFQKQQSKINRYVAKKQFKNPDCYFTASMLESRQMITKGLKGGNPEIEGEKKGFDFRARLPVVRRKVPPDAGFAERMRQSRGKPHPSQKKG